VEGNLDHQKNPNDKNDSVCHGDGSGVNPGFPIIGRKIKCATKS
jgi:hypothetical protein